MTKRRLYGALCAGLLMALGSATLAQADDYEVEVIVFRHVAPQSEGAWSTATSLPDFNGARRLAAPSEDTTQEPAAFTQLPATALRLAGVEKLLKGSAAHEVVAHQAWRQSGDAGTAVYVGDPAVPPDGAALPPPVAATAEAATLLPPVPPRARAEGVLRLQVALPEIRVQSDFVVMAGDVPVRVRATRNLHSGELHYLDHELLGILLQITSLAPAAPAPVEITAPNQDAPVDEFSD